MFIASGCMLCGGVDALTRPHEFVNSKGKTCAELMVDMFSMKPIECEVFQKKFERRCCSFEKIKQIKQEPIADAVSNLDKGPYQECQLCHNNAYPFDTSMVINMLYIGIGTCKQYWEYGQKGWIPDHLCHTLQFFAYEPCGCDFN